MSAPSADDIKGMIIEKLPAQFKEDPADLDDELKMRTNYPDRYTNDGITKELDIFLQDIAEAIAATWSDVEDAFVIASIPVMGGSSTPSGPLQGGVATLLPGMLTNAESFTLVADKFSTLFSGGATEGLLALVDAIAQGIGQEFSLWVAGYQATLTASGGTCDWIAPAPPGNPTGSPGPWSDGEIEDFWLKDGTSTGDSGMSREELYNAVAAKADPVLRQNQDTLQPALKDLMKAIAGGFETTWTDWKKNTKISGGSGNGTAVPPSGSISTGEVTSPQIT